MVVIFIIQIILSALFAYAGIIKIVDPEGMRQSIEAYRIVSGPLAIIGAYTIPWMELLAALGLWWRPVRSASALIILGLTTVFLIAITAAWARGLSLSCGCFGAMKPGEVDDYRWLFSRDIAIFLSAAYCFYVSLKTPKT